MPADLLHSRRGTAVVIAAIAGAFLLLRVVLLFARDPFFDELFTLWISHQSFAGIIEALRHDSGPPLYYFVVHALGVGSIDAIRVLSLIAAAATLVVILLARRFGNARFVAAALLAVYPPAVLFAIDARSYALCAMFVAVGVVAICAQRPFVAAAAFVLAAYSHDYGVLFFPLLLVPCAPASERRTSSLAGRLTAFAGALVLFIPGFWLALEQPRRAMQWLTESRLSWGGNLWFAGDYPYGLFAPAPPWLVGIAALALLVALAGPLVRRGPLPPVYRIAAVATLLPLAAAVAAGVYFPMRTESVIAVPLMLWTAVSLDSWDSRVRRVLFAVLVVSGLTATYEGIADHARRPLDPYRTAALWTAAHVSPGETVAASGYCYLEAVTNVHARVIAFPPEQAIHPGWRAFPTAATVPPAGPFVWIGERAAPELSMLRKTRIIKPLYANDRALVAAVR